MIPVSLITGFLGSGKTTFLKEIIARNPNRKFVYLINEFSPADIDGELINDTNANTVSIPGGSIFCKCLVTQFIHQLTEIPEKFNTEEQPVEKVIIEASGITDPKVIRKMLKETYLNDIYEMQSVISIIDPISFPKLLHTLPNIRSQVESADIIILNKIDLASNTQLDQTESAVKSIAPDTQLIKTIYCETESTILDFVSTSTDLSGEYARCVDPHYSILILRNNPHSVEQLKSIIAPICDYVYRLKGFIKVANEFLHIDYSISGWKITPTPLTVKKPCISMIINGEKRKMIVDYLKDFELM